MKKLSALLCTVLLAIGLVSCTEEGLDTAQYSDTAVTLASFGPNPVMRGGQLRFFGSNLQDIVEVNVPGVGPINAIQVVSSGKVSEISVTLPVEGPEVGYVTIKSKDGKTFKTKSELTYTEPIVFESFSVTEPAYPGDVITIKGDYMNLVNHVVFEGGATAYVESGATRHEATVVIPAEAISGKIILSDGAEVENLFYSEAPLIIGQPTVIETEKMNVKVGDELTIEGEHLEMIKSIIFSKGEETLTVEDFTFDGAIHLTVPETATDGTFAAVSFAGDFFLAGEIEFIMPSEITVENTPKAGEDLIISGNDLDVVSKVDFDGAADAAFSVVEGKLNITVPATAKEGNVILYHKNGSTVEVAFSIVHPTITAVTPTTAYAGEENITVTGTDLDLAVKATIGTKDVTILEQSETSLILGTDVTSVSGVVTIYLANEEVVKSNDVVTMQYRSKVVVTSRPAGQHIGQEVVIKGTNMDLVESVYVGDTKVTKYAIRTPEELRFLMPWCKVGSYELKFQLYDGDVETQAEPIEVLLEQDIKSIWKGNFVIGAWDGGMGDLSWGGYDWSTVAPGTELIVHYLINPGDYHQMRGGNGSWSALPSWKLLPGSDGDGNVPVSEDGYLSIKLTAEDLNELVNNGGLVLCGAFFIVTEVQLVSDISQEITVYQGPCNLTWDDTGRFGIAMKYFEQCQPGSKLIFYVNFVGGDVWGQAQINDAAWSAMKFAELGNDGYINPSFIGAGDSRIELTLTEDILNHILATSSEYFGINTDTGDGRCGMIVQGADLTIKQVTILP